jgi:hypothetical protein
VTEAVGCEVPTGNYRTLCEWSLSQLSLRLARNTWQFIDGGPPEKDKMQRMMRYVA